MRKSVYDIKPENGELRIVTKFLLFPKKLKSIGTPHSHEWRWLEKASWVQRHNIYFEGYGPLIGDYRVWEDLHWARENEKELVCIANNSNKIKQSK